MATGSVVYPLEAKLKAIELSSAARKGMASCREELEAEYVVDLEGALKGLEAALATGVHLDVLAVAAFEARGDQALAAGLREQPPWSDFACIVLTQRSGTERTPAAARLGEILGNVAFLERPFHPTTLASMVSTAVRSRRRQYEARAHLEELSRERAALAELTDNLEQRVRERTADLLAESKARERAQEQLLQSQKMDTLGQLTGGVAHDFNNLLTVIAGYCGILLDRLPPDDPLRSDVRAIADAGHRAASLTQRLLAFSRRAVLTPKVVDVNSVVRETEHILRRLIGEDILLSVALLPGGGLVKVDPGHLGQVLINLAVNARDALPGGGGLTIRTEQVDLSAPMAISGQTMPAGRYVRLVVSDTGHGMSPEVKGRIFEPFFTTKGVGKGTGLGLAVVHGFVKQSGGYIEVDSEEGKGATFSISLPIIDEASAAAPATPADVSARGKETILLVEDEEAVRHLLARGLRNYGFTVMTASDGAEALRLVHDRTPHIDLLATDVVMPNMSGRDLADRLRQERAGLKVLFMSGYTDDTLLRHGVYEAREAFLQKPFALQAFAAKVREILDQE
jgi:signal transduction histidine kinase